jgi:murein DD-endopeptidase MepM/ murein hydrolase activator NlpD
VRRAAATIVAVLVLVGAWPAFAEITPADLDEARAEIRAVAATLEERVAAYDAAVAREAELRDQLDGLVVSLAARERELVAARRAARDRAADMYMSAGADASKAAIVSDEEMGQYPARYAYLESVSQTDREVVVRLEVARRDFEQQRAAVDGAIEEQELLRAEMDTLVESIYGELERVNADYQELRAEYEAQEEERRLRELFFATSTTTTTTTIVVVTAPPTTAAPATTAATTTTTAPSTDPTTTTTAPAGGGGAGGETTTTTAPPTTTTTTAPPAPAPSGRACPVDGAVTFRDSWGEPRSGGRTHKGVDMMAARWTPLVAIEAGTIYQVSWHSAGGLGVYLRGVSGGTWYYAHNEATASGISPGVRVEAGQLIAYVGSSGNASTPHVHFGWQPQSNWVYANPYPIVNELCR